MCVGFRVTDTRRQLSATRVKLLVGVVPSEYKLMFVEGEGVGSKAGYSGRRLSAALPHAYRPRTHRGIHQRCNAEEGGGGFWFDRHVYFHCFFLARVKLAVPWLQRRHGCVECHNTRTASNRPITKCSVKHVVPGPFWSEASTCVGGLSASLRGVVCWVHRWVPVCSLIMSPWV